MPYGLAHDIQTCRSHHAVLRGLLETFPAPSEHALQVRTALHNLATVLVRHLAFEDARLYPVLEAGEPSIAARARRYREEMGDLSLRFDAFLERWSAEGAVESDARGFARDWHAVRTALHARMDAEDDDLYEVAEHRSG